MTPAPVPPVAQFTANTTSGTAPLTVRFTDESTGTIASRTWEFRKDGSAWTTFATGAEPVFSFAEPGSYDIRLTVSGPEGSDSELKTGYITVFPHTGPIADFSASPLSGDAPLTVRFTDLSTGTITLRMWDFQNDGQVDSIARNPTYTYRTPGTYSVRLRITGPDGGNERIREAYITVIEPPKPPVARFTQSPQSGFVPLTVQFTNLSTGAVDSYLWNFGDGTSSTEPNPVHTYSRAGFYQVTLKASNSAGSSSTFGLVFAIPSFRMVG